MICIFELSTTFMEQDWQRWSAVLCSLNDSGVNSGTLKALLPGQFKVDVEIMLRGYFLLCPELLAHVLRMLRL